MSPSGRTPPLGDGEGDSEGDELTVGLCPPSEEGSTPRVQEASSTKKLIKRKGAAEYPVRPFGARGMHRLYRLIAPWWLDLPSTGGSSACLAWVERPILHRLATHHGHFRLRLFCSNHLPKASQKGRWIS
jgi:hypothetical protein